MTTFSIIEVDNPRWTEIVNNSKQFDFYHTQSYHLLEKGNRPVLLVASFKEDFIAFPLIIRAIPNSNFFDCTSVYGYCGLLSSMLVENIPPDKIDFFKNQILIFFSNHTIIAAFSRLHPLISTDVFFTDFGTVKNINKTVAIDLKLTLDEQRKQYRKSNKSELNQLRRKGFEVVKAITKDDIDSFIDIYHETMKRVDAGNNYYFDHNYFYNFLGNGCFKAKLLLAKIDGQIAAGAIFTITDKIMQYHLAGTTETFIKETPMKLIIDEARLLGNELGIDFLHLGGGVGGSDEDSLFRFKSGFSDYRCEYKIWQMIVNQKIYDELTSISNVDKNSSFFPLYRG